MTAVLRLRQRVDDLADERDKAVEEQTRLRGRVRNLEAQLGVRDPGHCCYCGAPTRGRACAAHSGLLRSDPHYAR